MLILAASALEKAASLPGSFWLKVGLGVAAFLLAVVLLRKLMETNKVILIAVGFVLCSLVFINWVYERNEPAFLTPIVNVLAEFLPTKGAYEVRQQTDPTPGKNPKPTPKPKR
ncbi:MAG TPA: hypothetical protein VFT72_19820 [Opitutaceae bacterium]|nr:hypothetical protein [Opitutaceae bacterium]